LDFAIRSFLLFIGDQARLKETIYAPKKHRCKIVS